MFCPSCGNQTASNAAFCSRCGETLSPMALTKRGPSNGTIALAAIAAAASIGLALWSSFRTSPVTDDRSARASAGASNAPPPASPTSLPTPTSTLAGSPTPSASPSPPMEIEPGDYQTYHNDRFDYSIAFPSNFLIPQGAFGNGDGQRFASKDGRVVMTAFGQHNAQEKSLVDLFNEELKPNRLVTYKVLKKKWFVVSGYEGSRVFYRKTILKDDVIKTFHIEADRTLQPLVQPMTEKIVKSFK